MMNVVTEITVKKKKNNKGHTRSEKSFLSKRLSAWLLAFLEMKPKHLFTQVKRNRYNSSKTGGNVGKVNLWFIALCKKSAKISPSKITCRGHCRGLFDHLSQIRLCHCYNDPHRELCIFRHLSWFFWEGKQIFVHSHWFKLSFLHLCFPFILQHIKNKN